MSNPAREADRGPVLVGYGPEDRGHGGLELARLIAATSGSPLRIVCVIPDRWGAVGPGRGVDKDYHDYLASLAEHALAQAREAMVDCGVQVDYEVVTARSAPAGLTSAAQAAGAWLLVAGSSADGAWGHIALGSTSDRMLHSSRIPVVIAPRGQRYAQATRITRVTAAVDGAGGTAQVLSQAAGIAEDLGAALRVVSFAVRRGTMYPPEVGLDAEDRVVEAWRAQAAEAVRRAIGTLALPEEPQVHIAEGRSWDEALEEPTWDDGELLVVGSSQSESRLSWVFLGSNGTRIIRHSPVPVVVVPGASR